MATTTEFSIDNFTGKFTGGGALASLFRASVTPPTAAGVGINEFEFFCKASQFPTSAIDVVDMSYMGRQFRIPGNRPSQDWTCTIYNDENHLIRSEIEYWMDGINSHAGNVRSMERAYNTILGTATVQQAGKRGGADTNTNKKYTFHGLFPYTVAEITVDWETNDIQTYDVTWAFTHWETSNTGSATAIGAR